MSDPYRSYQSQAVPENSTVLISGKVQDELGAALPGASVDILELTLIVQDGTVEGAVVGSWQDRNIKNANGGVLNGDGTFTVTIPPTDITIPAGAGRVARYAALFKWTWQSGKTGHYRHSFPVADLEQTPP